jgi:predicted AlkP superfamily phosphohydrolase/phosphomutase
MKLSSMISELQRMKDELGDVEVLISDGHSFRFYSGNYRINRWDNEDGQPLVDIGIGGCLEESIEVEYEDSETD